MPEDIIGDEESAAIELQTLNVNAEEYAALPPEEETKLVQAMHAARKNILSHCQALTAFMASAEMPANPLLHDLSKESVESFHEYIKQQSTKALSDLALGLHNRTDLPVEMRSVSADLMDAIQEHERNRTALLRSIMRWAWACSKRFCNVRYISMADADEYQAVATEGALRGVDLFEAERDTRLITYATYWIMARLRHHDAYRREAGIVTSMDRDFDQSSSDAFNLHTLLGTEDRTPEAAHAHEELLRIIDIAKLTREELGVVLLIHGLDASMVRGLEDRTFDGTLNMQQAASALKIRREQANTNYNRAMKKLMKEAQERA